MKKDIIREIIDREENQVKKMWNEFKEFAFKGNVIDMAVGVIIGGAFSKIVTSPLKIRN